MHQSIRNRILQGIAAQGFGHIVNIIIQVISVPLFLHSWGKNLYGEWLILSTIPGYLALSDFGFASATSTDMSLKIAQNDKQGALKVFQSSWVLITIIPISISLPFVYITSIVPFSKYLNIHQLPDTMVFYIIIFMLFQVIISLQSALLLAGFRCAGYFAIGTMAFNIQRLIEFSGMAIILLIKNDALHVAICVTVIRFISFIVIRLELKRRVPWITYGIKNADLVTLKSIASPAIAFMGFPIGNALSLQGIITIIGIRLGPGAAVLFSTSRTLTRFVFQLINAVSVTVWVELSFALGSKNLALARKLHDKACQLSFWLAIVASLILVFTGKFIFMIWTHDKLPYDPILFHMLLIVVIFNSLWSTSYTVSMAINKHQRISFIYLCATLLSLFLAYVLSFSYGIHGIALALLIIDMMMIAFVLPISLRILGESLFTFMIDLILSPILIIRNLKRVRS